LETKSATENKDKVDGFLSLSSGRVGGSPQRGGNFGNLAPRGGATGGGRGGAPRGGGAAERLATSTTEPVKIRAARVGDFFHVLEQRKSSFIPGARTAGSSQMSCAWTKDTPKVSSQRSLRKSWSWSSPLAVARFNGRS